MTVRLVTRKDEAREDVIAELELLLDQARAGEIRGLVYATTRNDGRERWGVEGLHSSALLGGFEFARHMLCEMMRNSAEDAE